MKPVIYFFATVWLVSGFFACKKNPEVGPDDTSAIDPFTPPVSVTAFVEVSSTLDVFADLSATFPESANYWVSGIDVKDITGEKAVISARFSYVLASGQLAYKLYQDYRRIVNSPYYLERKAVYPDWRHDYVFDAQNRLLNEKSVFVKEENYEYFPVDIIYEYEGNLLKKIVKKSAGYANYGTMGLSLVTTYRYQNSRRVEATILNYYYGSALSNLEFPWDSTRRKFIYSNNNQTITEQDSSWYVPCFPKVPCINRFMNVDSTQRQLNAKGNLLAIQTTLSSPLYPKGITTFQYEYNGPDGLLSRITNVNAGLIYHFRYLEK